MIGSCITLEDLHNGIITDLRLDTAYTFFSDSSISVSPRFNLNINVAYDIEVTNSTCYNDSLARIKLHGNNIIGSNFKLLNSYGLAIDSILAASDTIIFDHLNSGLYNFVTNDSSNCSIENQNIIITSPEEILPDFQYSDDTSYVDSSGTTEIFFNNQTEESDYYLWDFGNGNTSTLKNPSQNFLPGIYDVTLITSNDSLFTCNSTVLKTIVVLDSSSLTLNENSKSRINFKISDKNLIIIFDNVLNLNDNYIDIFDISGRLILSRSYPVFNNSIKVPLDKFINGIYIFKIYGESYKFVLK
jgi:PKD repeat protein